jgi:hypothetical protein
MFQRKLQFNNYSLNTFNMPDMKKIPVFKIVIIVWLVLSTCYVIYGEYTRLTIYVGQRAYNAGITNAVNQLIEQTKACQPIPITSGDQKVEVISVACLKAPAGTEAATK